MGTDRRAEDQVNLPGRALYPTAGHVRRPDHVTFPVPQDPVPSGSGPIWHSTAMLHSQVAGEGHNNKEFAP